MNGAMKATHGPTSWLCPDGGDRHRLLDMEQRLLSVRRVTFLVLGATLISCGQWVGYWTLIPLALAVLGFAAMDRGLEDRARPEYRIGAAWVFSQLAIAASVALTGGPDSPAVAWLAIPAVTLPARFSGRGVFAGLTITVVLMLASTVGVDAGAVAADPQLLLFPLALLAAVVILSSALMQSDREHRSEAVVDPLTGMLNRNALLTRAAELAQQSSITQMPVAVVVGDLDRFKSINDGHGHAAGDAVLRDAAYRMRKQLRAYDLAYRIGGEEFVILLPGANAAEAAGIAEQIRTAIASQPTAGLMVTMSFGVSASEPGEFAYQRVFAEADQALYRSKHEGRDRVTCWEHVAEPAELVPA
jgi:diguanylate cyclase (GGDEF)-like protein